MQNQGNHQSVQGHAPQHTKPQPHDHENDNQHGREPVPGPEQVQGQKSGHSHGHGHGHGHEQVQRHLSGQGHSHGHGHGHGHSHVPHGISTQKMAIATAITFAFALFEAFVGYRSNSLALIADAGHNLTDGLALALSAFAIWMAGKPADARRSFGYQRVGILAALANALGLVIMAGLIFWESIERLQHPEAVQSQSMIWTALAAIVINSGIALWFAQAAKQDLNIRSAYVHMLGDAAASFAVVLAGVIIMFTGWTLADPLVSILFAALVLWSSWGILKESIQVLLEGVPDGLDLQQVEQRLKSLDGVQDVHHLHVWTIASARVVASCHIVVRVESLTDGVRIQQNVSQSLEHEFGISQSTVQIETESCQA